MVSDYKKLASELKGRKHWLSALRVLQARLDDEPADGLAWLHLADVLTTLGRHAAAAIDQTKYACHFDDIHDTYRR